MIDIMGQSVIPQTALPLEAFIAKALGPRSVVLVGMMGSGKSSIGRRLALRLGISFVDADTEIEQAAGMTIPDIFSVRGEAEFRAGEARVILRLLEGGPQVLSTGGGAFYNAPMRAALAPPRACGGLHPPVEGRLKGGRPRQYRPLS